MIPSEGGMIIVFGALLSVLMVSIVAALLAKRQLSEKYAVLWLIIGLAAIVITVVPGLLGRLTAALGVQVPANLMFGGAILLLVGVALHLSWELSRAENEVRRLAEESAINRLELEQLARRLAALEGSAAAPAETAGGDAENGGREARRTADPEPPQRDDDDPRAGSR